MTVFATNVFGNGPLSQPIGVKLENINCGKLVLYIYLENLANYSLKLL